MALGRPSDYTDETAIRMLTRLTLGEGLVRICRDEDMPHVSTVYRWLQTNQDFRDRYELARAEQADTLADQLTDIADNATPENVQVARLRVDARKWIAAKLKPKKYGDKVQNEVTGANGGPLVVSWQP